MKQFYGLESIKSRTVKGGEIYHLDILTVDTRRYTTVE